MSSEQTTGENKLVESLFGAVKTALYILILPPLILSIIIICLFCWYSTTSTMVKVLASIPLFFICFYVFLKVWIMLLNSSSTGKEEPKQNIST